MILLGLQWIGLALNFLLAWLIPAAAIPWQRTGLFFLGLSAMLLGVALRWYAIGILGSILYPGCGCIARPAGGPTRPVPA